MIVTTFEPCLDCYYKKQKQKTFISVICIQMLYVSGLASLKHFGFKQCLKHVLNKWVCLKLKINKTFDTLVLNMFFINTFKTNVFFIILVLKFNFNQNYGFV